MVLKSKEEKNKEILELMLELAYVEELMDLPHYKNSSRLKEIHDGIKRRMAELKKGKAAA